MIQQSRPSVAEGMLSRFAWSGCTLKAILHYDRLWSGVPARLSAALQPLLVATRPQFSGWPPATASDLRLFRYLEGIVDLDAQVPHCRLQLGVAEQQLHSVQVLGAGVDQCRLRPAHRVCPIVHAVQA